MQTITKKYYVCDICGKTSQQEEKIKECQSLHRQIDSDTSVEAVYNKGKEFPQRLYITFEDGTRVMYSYALRDGKA